MSKNVKPRVRRWYIRSVNQETGEVSYSTSPSSYGIATLLCWEYYNDPALRFLHRWRAKPVEQDDLPDIKYQDVVDMMTLLRLHDEIDRSLEMYWWL